MFNDEFVAGSAIPPTWDLKTVLRFAERTKDPAPPVDRSRRVNLVEDLIDNTKWGIRNQFDRGTCNAFAVVAAEELARLSGERGSDIEPLSEEQLYFSMRQICPNQVGIKLTAKELENLSATGTTFLAQAVKAIEDVGICKGCLMPYDTDTYQANAVASQIPHHAEKDAATRRLPSSAFVHNIICVKKGNAQLNTERVWVTDIGEFSVSDIFARKLQEGLPVVASFAILSGNGYEAWLGPEARKYGEVNYPSGSSAESWEAEGGHTVCIVGFEPHESDPEKGWFMVRNSIGEVNFAWRYKEDEKHPRALARGYGYISTEDVDRYCWEYLYRSGSADTSDI